MIDCPFFFIIFVLRNFLSSLYFDKVILVCSQSDFYCMCNTCFPFRIRVCHMEMIMFFIIFMTSAAVFPYVFIEYIYFLQVSSYYHRSAHAWSSATGSNEASIPTFGIIGISFSGWQSQLGDTSQISDTWKHGLSLQTARLYSAIL